MGRTKLDNRIRTLIENGVKSRHRSMFVVIGDKARDQVVILHHILTKASLSSKKSVLWCYKKELGFSSHRKKRMKEIQKKIAAGVMHTREDDPFELFISSTEIRYCYYTDSHKILGNTFGMLILQDFEALTPNLLARTIETVEGGGLVVFLLQSVNSLRQLYTLTMDVHARYRTGAHREIVARFNERFILSLGDCRSSIVMDDRLNILPLSSHMQKIEPLPHHYEDEVSEELMKHQQSMADVESIGPLVMMCKTACQAKALLRLLDVITERKSLNVTCSLTAARGRGKSAALGLSLAGAVAFNLSNMFVTSPTPENLNTLFEFVVKGLQALGYNEHSDFEVVRSMDPEMNKSVIRINIFREHRQTIQYIQPSEATKLDQAELVVIDEAAAIPVPVVRELISGSYVVFLASTINGYEGTGRSLSLKLLEQLRQQSTGSGGERKKGRESPWHHSLPAKKLYELALVESIRYRDGDPIEQWLNTLLCLDCIDSQSEVRGIPPPKECELYYVNRDTLFSFHRASEQFLSNLMSIYVSAHYKNTPNDLQMLSDAPVHSLFVLMAPVSDEQTSLPQILAVIHVCLEGALSKKYVSDSLEHGKRASGDLIPWIISQQFLDDDFPTLTGIRVVRIAVHPDLQGMGYGSRAMQLLQEYYKGDVPCECADETDEAMDTIEDDDELPLLEEQVEPKANLPPLLLRLNERRREEIDYFGVSFGLTLELLKFWKRLRFVPAYLRQSTNDLTGEHTCIMLRMVESNASGKTDEGWIDAYFCEFRHRLIPLLGSVFSHFTPHLALSLLHLKSRLSTNGTDISRTELGQMLSNSDLRRLAQYAKNMVDLTMINDLLPAIAMTFFKDKIPSHVNIDLRQAVVLLCVGLQRKDADQVAKELELPINQTFALLNKCVRRLSEYFDTVCKEAISLSAA